MKKKRSSLFEVLVPKLSFNKLAVGALVILFSTVINSDAQFQDYGNYDFNGQIQSDFQGSGFESPPDNNVIQTGKYFHK